MDAICSPSCLPSCRTHMTLGFRPHHREQNSPSGFAVLHATDFAQTLRGDFSLLVMFSCRSCLGTICSAKSIRPKKSRDLCRTMYFCDFVILSLHLVSSEVPWHPSTYRLDFVLRTSSCWLSSIDIGQRVDPDRMMLTKHSKPAWIN